MRRFLRFSFRLTVVLLLASTAAILLARHDPQKIYLLPFSGCELPCLAGATLGQATVKDDFQQLSERISQHGYVLDPTLTLNGSSSFRWRKPGLSAGVYSGISAELYDQVLQRFAIQYDTQDSATPKLGDVINTFGTPSCFLNDGLVFDANLNRQQPYNNLYYMDKDYLLTINVGALVPYQPVSSITLQSSVGTTPGCPLGTGRWRGFSDY